MSNRNQSTQGDKHRKWTKFANFSEAAAWLQLQQTDNADADANHATNNGVHKASINGSPPVKVLQEAHESEAIMLDTIHEDPAVHNEASDATVEVLPLGPDPAEDSIVEGTVISKHESGFEVRLSSGHIANVRHGSMKQPCANDALVPQLEPGVKAKFLVIYGGVNGDYIELAYNTPAAHKRQEQAHFDNLIQTGTPVRMKVTNVKRRSNNELIGVEGSYLGRNIFVAFHQVDWSINLSEATTLPVVLLKEVQQVNSTHKTIVRASQKKAAEVLQPAAFASLSEGDVVLATVRSYATESAAKQPIGLVVSFASKIMLDGEPVEAQALLPTGELVSHGGAEAIIPEIGSQHEVMIYKLDSANERIRVSTRRLLQSRLLAEIQTGQKVSGWIQSIVSAGALLVLDNGFLVLLSRRAAITPKGKRLEDVFSKGQKVENLTVSRIDPDKLFVWVEQIASQRYKVGEKVQGKILSTSDEGAEIELADGIVGKLSVESIPGGINVLKGYRSGQLLTVIVAECDGDQITLKRLPPINKRPQQRGRRMISE